MAAVFSPWLRRKVSPLARPANRRPSSSAGGRLRIESLEDRTLLDSTPISSTQAQALVSGLQQLANLGGTLNHFDLLSQPALLLFTRMKRNWAG